MPVTEKDEIEVDTTERSDGSDGSKTTVEEVLLESDSIQLEAKRVWRNRALLIVVVSVVILGGLYWITPKYLQEEGPPVVSPPIELAVAEPEDIVAPQEPVEELEHAPIAGELEGEGTELGPVDELVALEPEAAQAPEEKKALERPKYPSERKVHFIQRGDTLWEINMTEFGRSHQDIYMVEKQLNPEIVDENLIYAGRDLILPRNDELPQ